MSGLTSTIQRIQMEKQDGVARNLGLGYIHKV